MHSHTHARKVRNHTRTQQRTHATTHAQTHYYCVRVCLSDILGYGMIDQSIIGGQPAHTPHWVGDDEHDDDNDDDDDDDDDDDGRLRCDWPWLNYKMVALKIPLGSLVESSNGLLVVFISSAHKVTKPRIDMFDDFGLLRVEDMEERKREDK